MRPESEGSKGVFAVMAMLLLLLIIVGAIAIRVFIPSKPASDQQPNTDASLAETLKNDLAQVKEQLGEALERPSRPLVEKGVYVRKDPNNSERWIVTVSYPELAERTLRPSFEFSYPDTAPWGLMQMTYRDLTANDFSTSTPYLAKYIARAANNSEETDGYIFYLYAADRAQYDVLRDDPKSIYAHDEQILVGEDDLYVYLYRYANDDEDVRAAVDALMNTFISLNTDIK